MSSLSEEDREFLRYRDSGEPQAMARVFDLTASRLLLLAMHLLGDVAEAEDLVQTTFLRAIHDADRFQPRGAGSVLAWLMQILTHRARDMQKHKRRRREGNAAPVLDLNQDHRPGPLDELQGRDTLEHVQRVLDGLPQPYRHVVILRLVHGLKAVEIAHSLDRSPESVRTQLRRGLKMLRDRLPRSLMVPSMFGLLASEGLAAVKTNVVKAASASKAVALASSGGSLTGIAWITGALLMTTKTKLTTLAVGCAALLAALWALQEPTGDGGVPYDVPHDNGGGRLVSEPEGGNQEARTAADAVAPTKRTEVSPASRSKLGSLLVQAIWARDKTPAAGVMLRTMYGRRRSVDPLLDDRSGFTDDKGTLRIADLKPGPMYVQSYRGDPDGGQKVAHIKAGQQATVQIVVPVGLDLRGIVVDQSGSPVAGASILVAPRHGWGGGHAAELARSGADGSFHLPDLAAVSYPPAFVGARARGHAPSVLYRVRGKKGEQRQLRIVLGGRGGRVTGRVLDPRGQPVPGAIVQVGEDKQDPKVLWPGSDPPLQPLPVRVRTARKGGGRAGAGREDAGREGAGRAGTGEAGTGEEGTGEDGEFAIIGAVPGEQPIAVRARGLAPWFGTVHVPTDGDTELVVHLLSGATVHGIARGADGQPVAGAHVTAATGNNPMFARRFMETGADGSYRLEDLGPGKVQLRATSKAGKAVTEVSVLAGQTLQWDPELRKGFELRGRVLDGQNEPAAGVTVWAHLQDPDKDRWWRRVVTDKDGRFTIPGCPPDKTIRLQTRSKAHSTEQVYTKPLQDERNLVIRVRRLGEPSVYITGQVLGPDDKPVPHCSVDPIDRHHSVSESAEPDVATGRFKLGPYPPGEYRVIVSPSNHPRVVIPWRTLAKGETWNLGTIRLQRPGWLDVSLKGNTGKLPKFTSFALLGRDGARVGHIEISNGKPRRSAPLAPGTYSLQILARSYLYTRHKCVVEAGQVTPLQVSLREGTPVVLDFVVEVDSKLIQVHHSGIQVEVRDSASRVVLKQLAHWVDRDPYRRRLAFGARPGRYKVTARATWTKARAQATLTVGDKPVDPRRIVLRLK